MPVNVQDNFLDKKYFKELQTEIISKDYKFPWFLSTIDHSGAAHGTFQMVHLAYCNSTVASTFCVKLQQLFEKLEVYSLQRVKINLQERQEKIIEHGMHIDFSDGPENALT